jgi:hypothetical protein
MVEHPAEILKRERTSRLIAVFLSRYPQFQDPGLPPPAQLQQLLVILAKYIQAQGGMTTSQLNGKQTNRLAS